MENEIRTEQMFRLLQNVDGVRTVTGYKHIFTEHGIGMEEFLNVDMQWTQVVHWDSLHLSFRFKGTWVFESDKVRISLGDRVWKGSLIYERLTWWLKTIDGYYYNIAADWDSIKSIKKVIKGVTNE